MHRQNLKIHACCLATLLVLGSPLFAEDSPSGSSLPVLVELDTSEGKIVIELNPQKAPLCLKLMLWLRLGKQKTQKLEHQ